MLRDIITELGTTRVAKECCVTPACVSYWKRKNGLPNPKFLSKRRERYERALARMLGVPVDELRQKIKPAGSVGRSYRGPAVETSDWTSSTIEERDNCD